MPMSNLTKVAIALIIVVVIAVSAVTVVFLLRAVPVSHTTQIVKGIATVYAGSYVDYPFTLPSDATSISVSGTFTASGGSGNDIKVYLFDSTDFGYYSYGGSFTTLYRSGQATTATISASLPTSGTYYLVLDNEFSSVSTKTVNIQASVTYTT